MNQSNQSKLTETPAIDASQEKQFVLLTPLIRDGELIIGNSW